MQNKGYLPLPYEGRRVSDVFRRRLATACLALIFTALLMLGVMLGLGGVSPPIDTVLRYAVIASLSLGAGVGAWWFVRKLYYYVPQREPYRFFVIDQAGRLSPAVAGKRYLRRQVIAIAPDIDLSTTVGRRLPNAEPSALYLFVTIPEDGLTIQTASQVNWFRARVLERRADMSQVHEVLAQVRRDHPDLPFRFSAKFHGYPQLDL